MKTIEEAIYAVAKEYAHAAHDSMFARVNFDKCEMIAFIFGLDANSVAEEVMNTFEENRKEFWR